MGCFTSSGTQQNGCIIASLNYSGIQDSPYEFFQSEGPQQLKLDSIFRAICSEYLKNFNQPKFKWKMGKFDKEWHTRFSPAYLPTCGVQQDRMMNEKQFDDAWEKMFQQEFSKYENKIYGKVSKQEKEKNMPYEKQECLIFDKCIYRTIIKYVYDVDDINKEEIPSNKYILYQKQKFHKAYLDGNLKMQRTLKAIQANSLDIFFIQQGNLALAKSLKNLENYYLIEELERQCTSMILIKKNKFSKIANFAKENQLFTDKYKAVFKTEPKDDFNFNVDSIIQVVGNIVLISSHLSSKTEKNPQQVKDMVEHLAKFRKFMPEYQYIMGGDINGPLKDDIQIQLADGKKQPINVFPNLNNSITVNKKRTLIQPQKHKANDLSSSVKDYLITSFPLLTKRVVTINNIFIQKGKKTPLLPNAQHPYDHYLVAGQVKIE